MRLATLRSAGLSMRRVCVLLYATLLILGTATLPSAVFAPAPIDGATTGVVNGVAAPVGINLPDGPFTKNLGQVRNAQVRFYLSSGNVNVGFAVGAVLLAIVEHADQKPIAHALFGLEEGVASEDSVATRGVLARISFIGANVVEPEGRGELPYRNHYFLSNDSSSWLTNVRNYREVVYKNLYDGIDLVYVTKDGRLKYEFHVSPGKNPAQIEMAYEGVDRLRLDSDGGIIAATAVGEVRDLAPVSYQGEDGIECPFSLRGHSSFGFACQEWDTSRALVIDPLVYSTFLGGSVMETPYDIVTDASGSAYIVGFTTSPDFPVTPGAFDASFNGTHDGFVARLNPDGSTLAWATFLGGSDFDWAIAASIDPSGEIYVVGFTVSTDFPVTVGAFDFSFNGVMDAFVARFAMDGVLIWATYLGGTGSDHGAAISLDSSGNIVVGIIAESPDFPVTPGAFDVSHNGFEDACIAKLDPSGSFLLWATFLGGSISDWIQGIALGADDSIYATGMTLSNDFPVTPGAFDTTYNGGANGGGDAYIAKLNSTGSDLVWATYLGGDDFDGTGFIFLDGSGNLYVAGHVFSSDFPATSGAFDETLDGSSDVFVAKLNSTGGALLWATFLGGSGNENIAGIALDVAGNVCVGLLTFSADFPVTPGAFDTTFNGTTDGVLAVLNPDGTSLLYATFFGGNDSDEISGMVLDSSGYVYLAGGTGSSDFPVTPGAFDTTYNGVVDAFVAKIGPVGPPNTPPVLAWTGEPNYVSDGLDPETGTTFTDFTYRVAYYDADNHPPAQINVKIEKPLGVPYGTFPMSFAAWKGMPSNYTTGAIYSFSTKLSVGTDFSYYFRAMDGWEWATGPPTSPIDAPDVNADNPPAAVAYASPTSAFINDTITFDATRSTDDFGITAYLWDFGDTATDTNSVTTHAYASRGVFLATLTVWDTANQSDMDTVSISIGNRPPVADAGPDQSVSKNDIVTLNGTGSSDPDGDPLSYAWTQTSGPAVTLAGADTATPTVTPPKSGVYAFQLVVNDSDGGTSSDTVQVTATNAQPVADAGPDQTVRKKTPVALDGSSSSDSDGDALTYSWTQTSGPTVTLASADTVSPTFTPPRSGLYAFQLIVDDGDGGVATDTVVVTATNAPPVADAGSNQTAWKNALVTLDGSLSSDSDGDMLTFSWTQLSGPPVTLTGADTATPSFTPTKAGTCAFRLSVSDGDGGTSEDSTNVTVWGLPPNANLVADPPTAHLDEQIRFDASGSTDPDGTIVDFTFSFGDNTSASGIEAVSSHSYAAPGAYIVTLTVTDDDGNVSTAQVTVEVTSLPPPPAVEANYKPLIALVFAIVLAAAGLWSSKRRPWKGEKDRMAVVKAFAIVSLPFVLAEAVTGVVSFATGRLSVPPWFGSGTIVDLMILMAGLGVPLVRILKTKPSEAGVPKEHKD